MSKKTRPSPAKPTKKNPPKAGKAEKAFKSVKPSAKAPSGKAAKSVPPSSKKAPAPEKRPHAEKKPPAPSADKKPVPPPVPDKKAAPVKPAPEPVPPAEADAKARKGVTAAAKSRRSAPKAPIVVPILGEALLKPGERPKPLIPSGPNAPPPERPLGPAAPGERKSPFTKKELDRFRGILLQKRAELVGDINRMEGEALLGGSGSLSHLPQHMAEQGSEAYDQALSLDLAAADRKLLKEIDDALHRINNGTYGLCELTGKPIKAERLEELPWARHSIEAARQLERRSYFP